MSAAEPTDAAAASVKESAQQPIALAAPDLSGNEERYVVDAVRSSWISSTGAYVDRFEREFATLCEAYAAVSVANGTAALHLALLALDTRPGDEILVPSLTYVAAANACRYVGAEPVLVDVDRETWCIDPQRVAERIGPRTKGIIAVHLYGHPADMDELGRVASEHGLWIVEDAAEAHLATYRGRPVGALATLGTFSFYGNKVLTSGEGGAVVLRDDRLEASVRLLRGQGMDPRRRYFFPVVGYNYRLTNVACALLCAQLEQRAEIMRRRREICALYRELLEDVPGIEFQPVATWAKPSPWLFCIAVDEASFGRSRDELLGLLGREGIETRPFFVPLHMLPPYEEASRKRRDDLRVSERLGATGANLPTHVGLSDQDVGRVADAVRRAAR